MAAWQPYKNKQMKKTLKLISEFMFIVTIFALFWASLWIFA